MENKWEVIYHWVNENLFVPGQLINILGERNVEEDADQDRDDDAGDADKGVEMANMEDKVF